MTSQIELFTKMAIALDRLIENAQKMKEGLRLKFSQKDLEELQSKQHKILEELGGLNKQLEKSPKGASDDELEQAKTLIREKLGHFQTLNQEFFDNISSNSRVIDSKDKKHK